MEPASLTSSADVAEFVRGRTSAWSEQVRRNDTRRQRRSAGLAPGTTGEIP